MDHHWQWSDRDRRAVHAAFENARDSMSATEKMMRNASASVPLPTREQMWRRLVICLATTQQKSGPGSGPDRLAHTVPFPVSQAICAQPDAHAVVQRMLASDFSLRRNELLASEIIHNHRALEQGGWSLLEEHAAILHRQRCAPPSDEHAVAERAAARAAAELIKGFGPKQSRNFWLHLDLARYEIPIDSRWLKWLESELDEHAPLQGLSNKTIASEKGHALVCEAIQALCRECSVLPCDLDAAVFATA